MKPVTEKELKRFVSLTKGASYNVDLKDEYKRLGKKILKEIAEKMGLLPSEYDIRWNPGGIACSGDHTLHTDYVYLALHDNSGAGWFYYRTCKGRNDYSGGPNQIVNWNAFIVYGLDELARILYNVHNKGVLSLTPA